METLKQKALRLVKTGDVIVLEDNSRQQVLINTGVGSTKGMQISTNSWSPLFENVDIDLTDNLSEGELSVKAIYRPRSNRAYGQWEREPLEHMQCILKRKTPVQLEKEAIQKEMEKLAKRLEELEV